MINLIVFFAILFANVWIWKIFSFSLLLGVLIIASSISLLIYFEKNKKAFLAIAFILLIFVFAKSFPQTVNLSFNEQEKLLEIQRVKEYPPITLLPVAHWLEERPETITVYKFTQNLSLVLDPNLYFFANHPRERAAYSEIERFTYILLPFFVYGIFLLISKKKYLFLILFSGIPLLVYSITGLNKNVEPLLFFPFFIVTIYSGITEFLIKIPEKKLLQLLVVFVLLYILVFAQNIIYAIQ